MKIRKPDENTVVFRNLEPGEVFRRCGGNLYIKFEAYRDEHSDSYWNAVQLESGCLSHVDADELVILVDCELVVK